MEGKRMLSPQEAADRLGVSVSLVRKIIRQRELQSAKIGRRIVIDEDWLREFIQSRKRGKE